MDERATYSSSLVSFLLGGLAGAGLALLFAPGPGRETRGAVRRRVQGGVDAARGLKDRVVHRGRELQDEAQHALEDAERASARYSTDTSL